jgi:small conductance mechanosensitive channel
MNFRRTLLDTTLETPTWLKEDILPFLLEEGIQILIGLMVLIVGFMLTKYPVRILTKGMKRAKLDPSLTSFLASISSLGIKALIIVLAASIMGVETSAFVAIIGAASLAIGLALQGSLSNFAGGVLILIFKPFKVGDIITIRDQEGAVERIDILNTRIVGYDEKVIIAPNGELANAMIINHSEKPLRRVEVPVRLSYESDLAAAREIIINIFKQDARVSSEQEPVVVMLTMEESYIHLSARAWCKMDDYFWVYWDNIERITEALRKSSLVEIPVAQQDVYLKDKRAKKN